VAQGVSPEFKPQYHQKTKKPKKPTSLKSITSENESKTCFFFFRHIKAERINHQQVCATKNVKVSPSGKNKMIV
jgi:hypothetical protein